MGISAKEFIYQYLEAALENFPVTSHISIGILRFDMDIDEILANEENLVLLHYRHHNSQVDDVWNKFPFYFHKKSEANPH